MPISNPYDYFVLHVEDEPHYVEYLKKAALKALHRYGVEDRSVSWLEKPDAASALQALRNAEDLRPGRGFDALIVDLKLPRSKHSGYDLEHPWRPGMDVLSQAADFEWPVATLCVSGFADDSNVLEARDAAEGKIRVDDWIGKQEHAREDQLLIAKLERSLIPTERFVDFFRFEKPPLFIESPGMKALLREVVFLARRSYARWPLCRLLLLGDPGSGKGALSRAFYKLLPDVGGPGRAPFITLNCATAVSEGHGGRISLFGADCFGGGVPDRRGVFEAATAYTSKEKEPDPNRAGVVFLDEFAELAPDLQASILTALEDGSISREGSGRSVPICCHVVLATNFDKRSLVGTTSEISDGSVRVRQDLIDRIPYLLQVPALRERREEVRAIVEGLATTRLREYDSDTEETATLSARATQVLDRALRAGIINSIRQLQSIADILPGEWCITESNMAPILRKARILDKESLLTSSLGDVISTKEQAQWLALPEPLQSDDLPEITRHVVERFFNAFRPGGTPFSLSTTNFDSIEERLRAALLTLLISQDILLQTVEQKPDAVRYFRKRTFDACGLQLPTRAEEKEQTVVSLLLSEDDIGVEP